MNEDKLSSEERMSNLKNGKKIDRVPVIPHMEAFAGKICNYGTKDYYLNPQIAFECQKIAKELFNYDGGYGYGIPYGFIQEFGGKIDFLDKPKLSFPKIINYPINNIEEIDNLKIPDIKNSFIGKRSLKFNRISHKNGTGVGITAGSPMNIAQCIVGPDKLLRWTIKEPDAVHKVMRIATDYILQNALIFKNEFKNVPIGAGISCPMESHNVMSPKTFEKFSLPYLKEIYDKFDTMGINIGTVHLCGDHRKNLKYWTEYIKLKPRTLITVGTEFNLSDLASEIGENYIIGGNISNELLQLGTPSDIYNASKELILEMKNFKGGYVLTPDCTLSYLTPSGNLFALIKAARDFGSY